MNIELRFFATIRDAVGERTVAREVPPGTTVREVVAALEADCSGLAGMLLEDSDVADSITVLCNGTPLTHLDGAVTELEDGDRLAIMPPVTGGRPVIDGSGDGDGDHNT